MVLDFFQKANPIQVGFFCTAKAVRLDKDNRRLSHNQQALLSDIEYYKLVDSTSCAKIKALRLSIKEVKQNNQLLLDNLQKLNIKVKYLQSATQVTQTAHYHFIPDTLRIYDTIHHKHINQLHYQDKWIDFKADTAVRIETFDTLQIYKYQRYKRFL